MAEVFPTNSVAVKTFWALKDATKLGEKETFIQYLERCGLDSKIDDVRYGLTSQQTAAGTLRNIGVYVMGEGVFDADSDGTSRMAVTVDFILRNSDAAIYLKYFDALRTFLNRQNIGFSRFVANASFSHATDGENQRVTLIFIIELEPESQERERNTVTYL